MGTLAEIFDGDPPFTPRGCIAQAWTVGEVLRAFSQLAGDGRMISKDHTDQPGEAAAP